jgi:hypothetical protein
MKLLRRKDSTSSIQSDATRKLRRVADIEILRWVDNIHSGLGMNVQELRKSLGNADQSLIYLEDIRRGAYSLLAAIEVMEERRQIN